MEKILLLFVILTLVTPTIAQKSDERLVGVDREIQQLLEAYQAVGLSVAVVENDKVLYSKGFGFRDRDKKLPVTPDTLFSIGSATKAFTGSLLGILEGQNQLSIQDKPSKYLPKLRFYKDEMNNLINISDLLTHRSGLGNLDGTSVLFPPNSDNLLLPRLQYLKPASEVRGNWIYSNAGYILAGELIEKTSGQSWEKNIYASIFKPLEMNVSNTSVDEMITSKDFSFGYGLKDKMIKKTVYSRFPPGSNGAAGAINSSAHDMTKWLITFLNNGKHRDRQVIPENYTKEAISAKTITDGTAPNQDDPGVYLFSYGYGWFIASNKGHYRVMHGGNTSGFSSLVAFYPTDKFGVVVLSNQDNSTLPYIINDLITNRMLSFKRTEWNKYPVIVKPLNESVRKSNPVNNEKKPSHDLQDFAGQYSHPGYGKFSIKFERGSLYAEFPAYKFRLEHSYYDVFKLNPVAEINQDMNPESFYLNFLSDSDGQIAAVKINLQQEPVEFERTQTK